MKRLLLVGVMLLAGCASLTYESDGTKVTYSRLLTSSDIIKGKVGDASIEARGQQVIDPVALQTIIGILSQGK